MISNTDLLHKWTPWTALSTAIPFAAATKGKGKGDGEDRVAAEFNTVALGQNSSYDMTLTLGGEAIKGEVKKLDKGTFNTGVSGRNVLRPVKARLDQLLMIMGSLVDSPIMAFTDKQKELFRGGRFPLIEASPDELATGTLEKMDRAIQLLHAKQAALRATLPNRPLADPLTGIRRDVGAEQFYKVCRGFGRSIEDISAALGPSDFQKTEMLVSKLDHPYINVPAQLRLDLTGLRSVFEGMMLIFVDEVKGYYLLKDLSKINFCRITWGSVRFSVDV
jgi:hypothetical protein